MKKKIIFLTLLTIFSFSHTFAALSAFSELLKYLEEKFPSDPFRLNNSILFRNSNLQNNYNNPDPSIKPQQYYPTPENQNGSEKIETASLNNSDKAFDFPQSPIIPPATPPAPDINLGDSVSGFKDNAQAVSAVQQFLNENYGTNLAVDGKFGPKTMGAINKFRASENRSGEEPNLKISKNLDEKTLEKLDEAMDKGEKKSNSKNDTLEGGCTFGVGCVGRGISTFGHERDGRKELEGTDDGNTYCGKTRTVYYKQEGKKKIIDKDKNLTKCVAALSSKEIAKLCGGGNCFCGKTFARIKMGNKTVDVPVEDIGDDKTFKKNKVFLDVTGCVMNTLQGPLKKPGVLELDTRTIEEASVEIIYNGKIQVANKK